MRIDRELEDSMRKPDAMDEQAGNGLIPQMRQIPKG